MSFEEFIDNKDYDIDIDTLDINFTNITDLKGIGMFKNLKYLYCYKCDIESIDGIEELKYLSIWGNRITDLTPISELLELKTLKCNLNNITDLTPILKLNKLSRIYSDITDNIIVAKQIATSQMRIIKISDID